MVNLIMAVVEIRFSKIKWLELLICSYLSLLENIESRNEYFTFL
jgi:hypothetical protein